MFNQKVTTEEQKTLATCKDCKVGNMIRVFTRTVTISEVAVASESEDTRYYYCDSCGIMRKFVKGV